VNVLTLMPLGRGALVECVGRNFAVQWRLVVIR
jgi:hypothetical protein